MPQQRHARAASSAEVTTDHQTIRRWVEARGGKPAHVKSTGSGANDPGILRIDFPGDGPDPNLEPISWDQWFKAFDANRLGFLHENEPNNRFNKLVDRDSSR